MRCIRTETGRWVETGNGMLIPLPGAVHPAVVDVADLVRDNGRSEVRVVLPRKFSVLDDFDAEFNEVIFSQSLAYFPDWWGIWTWRFWIDDIGRTIAAWEMSWIQREILRPEFAFVPFVEAPAPHP